MINLSNGYSVPADPPMFQPGDVIFHKKYGYRGVVVDFDLPRKAPDAWYQSNQSQPDRNQPWYHILVDGNQQVTYAVQSNLVYDQLDKPVIHPMLNLFFLVTMKRKTNIYEITFPGTGNPPDAPLLPLPRFYTPAL